MIVADTILIAYLLIETEHTADAIRCRERGGHWVAPALWRHEFLNVLSTYVRAGKLNIDKAVELFNAAEERVETSDSALGVLHVLDFVKSRGVAAYDAEFLAEAEACGVRLVTADAKLIRASPDLSVSISDFAKGR